MRGLASLLYSCIFCSFFVLSVSAQPLGNQSTSHRIEARAYKPFENTSLWKLFNDREYLPGVNRITVSDFHFEPWNATSRSFVLMNNDPNNGVIITIVLNVGAMMLFLPREAVKKIQYAPHQKFWDVDYNELFKWVYIRTKDNRPGSLAQVLAEAVLDLESSCGQSLEVWDFRIQMQESRTRKELAAPKLMSRLKADIVGVLHDNGVSVSAEDIKEVPYGLNRTGGRKLSAILFERFPKSMSEYQTDARYRVLLGAQYKQDESDKSKVKADPAIVKPKLLTLIVNFWSIEPSEPTE